MQVLLLPSGPYCLVGDRVACVDCRAGHTGASAAAVGAAAADAAAASCMAGSSPYAALDGDRDLRSWWARDRDILERVLVLFGEELLPRGSRAGIAGFTGCSQSLKPLQRV